MSIIKILIIEDEDELAKSIAAYLAQEQSTECRNVTRTYGAKRY
ncbi:hypothetical protein [Sphingobacterium faecium]|nr:hypothetical protein [Sphingobacterium faecium]MDH5826779.1 hypothetical protein [Sphingobacterium faecium]